MSEARICGIINRGIKMSIRCSALTQEIMSATNKHISYNSDSLVKESRA